MSSYIFDTNIYDKILDGGIDPEWVRQKGEVYPTNVQKSELLNTPNIKRREGLLDILAVLSPHKLNLESGIWVDELRWDDDQSWRDDISGICHSLIGQAKKKKPWRDALIGEVAKKCDLILVTNDERFQNSAKLNGITAIGFDEFLKS